jgi:hypothetical protein
MGHSPLGWILANGIPPYVLLTSEYLDWYVEPLRDARTQLADFFSILLINQMMVEGIAN